jgi:hypothetical protein
MGLLAKIFSSLTVNAIIKVFGGISKPILDYYTEKGKTEVAAQGQFQKTLIKAAKIDVENRKLAQQERASSPFVMALYLWVVFWPATYYTLFWMDTIFSQIPPFTWFDLPRAPERLEEFGQYILVTFLGGGSAVYGVTKAVRIFKG